MRRRIALAVLCSTIAIGASIAAQTPDELFARAKALLEQSESVGDRSALAEGAKLMRQAITAGCSDQATASKLLADALLSLLVDIPARSPERAVAWTEVRETYQRAIALDPSDPRTRWMYSQTLTDIPARREVLEQALEIDPHYGPVLRAYGEMLFDQGSMEEGLAKWRESVEVGSNPVDVETNGKELVGLLESLGRADDAEAVKKLMATRLDEPATLRLLTGDDQEGRLGQTVNRLAVEVWTFGGRYAAGQVVSFAITVGAGTLSTAQATTGEDGIAATVLTIGDTPGLVTVEATWRDQTVVFHITAIQ